MRISDWSSDVCSSDLDRQPWLPTETVEVFGERSDRVRISGVRRAARACAPECIGIACLAGRDLARIVGGIGGNDEERIALTVEHGVDDRIDDDVAVGILMRWEHRGRQRLLDVEQRARSEEHTSELQSLMRISYAVFCLK